MLRGELDDKCPQAERSLVHRRRSAVLGMISRRKDVGYLLLSFLLCVCSPTTQTACLFLGCAYLHKP